MHIITMYINRLKNEQVFFFTNTVESLKFLWGGGWGGWGNFRGLR